MRKKVSVIIPTKNSSEFLEDCLASIRQQAYSPIEVLVVDSFSKDNTLKIAKKYRCKVFQYKPKIDKGLFEAPFKRNYGAKKATGEYLYYLDVDMKLKKGVIKEAVNLCSKKFDAVILPEDSFGEGVWASAKNLERRCYWGDDSVEAPRFVKSSVYKKIGGMDTSVGGGGDDWDLFQKLLENGYRVGRTKSIVLHNEGKLSLTKLIKKRFMYGRQTVKYISKRPRKGFISYFPIRLAYIRNWRLFVSRPKDALAFIIMRTGEYAAGFAGIMYSFLIKT